MERLSELLGRRRIVLGDGAMGTMLHQAGLTIGAPEQWNVKRPEVVTAIHRAYVEAGSDFVSTNTFGGTRNRLKLDNLEDRVAELNEAGARLAREAAGERLVAGSVGPTGESRKFPPPRLKHVLISPAAACSGGHHERICTW